MNIYPVNAYYQNLIKHLNEYLYSRPFTLRNKKLNRPINSQNTILIFAHPRGGSNWLTEVLLNIDGAVSVDEPLWRGFYGSVNQLPGAKEGKIQEIAQLGFYFDQPIPENAVWPEGRAVLDGILKGFYPPFDLYDKNGVNRLKNPVLFIVKFCFGHHIMHWLLKQYNVKAVVLHRHPCAVVSSQLMHMSFNRVPATPKGPIPEFRFNEIYLHHQEVFEQVNSREEYLAAIWAIKTKSVLYGGIKSNQITHVFYEHLICDFENQIKNIFDFLDLNYEDRLLKMKRMPSSSTLNKSIKNITSGNQLGIWKERLDASQIENILSVVQKFGINLYGENVMPETSYLNV